MTTSKPQLSLNQYRWRCVIAFLAWSALSAAGLAYVYFQNVALLPIKHFAWIYLVCIFIMGFMAAGKIIQWFYKAYYKKHIVADFLVRTLGETLYKPHNTIDSSILRHSGLFEPFTTNIGSDWFKSRMGSADLTAANVHLMTITHSDKNTYVNTVFKGAVVLLDFEKGFGLHLLIKEKRWLSWSKGTLNNRSLESVKLIAPGFIRQFQVWSDDQIISRKILKPALMEKMTALAQHTPFSLSIADNKVVIALQISLAFEPRFFLLPPRTEEKRVQRLSRSISVIKSVLETLKLEEKMLR